MINLGKLETAKKIVSSVGNAATGTVEKASEGNNLLLLILIVIVWLYLFFSKGDGK